MLPRFTRPFRRISTLTNWLTRDFENSFHKGFPTFEMLENNHRPRVDENTYYRMEQVINDNGQVKVKTAVKEPGKGWNISVEEYNKDRTSALQKDKSQEKVEAIEQGKTDNTSGNNVEAEKKTDKAAAPKDAETISNNTNTETSMKYKTKNDSDTSAKAENSDASKAPKERNNGNGNGKGNKHELSRRYNTPYDELQTIFDTMERDLENSFGSAFDLFDPYYENQWMRRHGQGRNRYHSRRYASPFDEIEAMFDVFERDFERDFDFFDYNPYNSSRRRGGYRHDRQLARRNDSPFDEIDVIFDSMERDLEARFRGACNNFEEPNRRARKQQEKMSIQKEDAGNGQEKDDNAQKVEETSKTSN